MMTKLNKKIDTNKDLYYRQNRTIHKARAQLCLSLDDCRDIAAGINGKASISSLTIRQRWELIEILKEKGARVYNPRLENSSASKQDRFQGSRFPKVEPAPTPETCSVSRRENPKDIYPNRLAYWIKRFPKRRPGFASNEQLAWIQALWELNFNDGRAGSCLKGLRGFIYRQTKNMRNGPVSDLAFLRSNQVQAIMLPLRVSAQKEMEDRKKEE